ncbi:uncharacterized protein LOC116930664 [Daphnia magna]|uniref:uncharacterized protein LOC116930664 n=1 Tax=Daphnia magna TaxID=35525 RepID=UPI001E1BD4C3|nr:uncharacterized protein LOC116930664 [Daphnia magna]
MIPTSARWWVYLVGLLLHLVSGLEECQIDSDCFSSDVYCLDGYCDGHCIPCQNFLRQPPYLGGCAKNKEDLWLVYPRGCPRGARRIPTRLSM